MNGPYTPLSSKNTYTKLGGTVSSTTWQPSYNAIKSGQARKVSATLATFQTALFVCSTARSAFSFLTCCTQDWLQSTYRAGGCLGHLCWLKVCAPSVSVMVRLPLFSLLQLHVFSSKFEKSFQFLSWKPIFYPLFSRTLKSQSYFSVHISGSFCCLSDVWYTAQKIKLWDSVFLHMWKYYYKYLHFQNVLFISSELRVCFVHNLKFEKNTKGKQCNAERLPYLHYYPYPS